MSRNPRTKDLPEAKAIRRRIAPWDVQSKRNFDDLCAELDEVGFKHHGEYPSPDGPLDIGDDQDWDDEP